MNIAKVDLNLLVYLDVLLREGSVTKAANQLSITQPAMSNGLKRLRDLFKDPLLVRTSDGMTPTSYNPLFAMCLVDWKALFSPRLISIR